MIQGKLGRIDSTCTTEGSAVGTGWRGAAGSALARALLLLLGVFTLSGPAVSTSRAEPAEWIQRDPTIRSGHAMVFDAARGVSVLFGGTSPMSGITSPCADTWQWNGAGGGAWTPRTANGPSARGFFAMAYDSTRGVTVLFGGSPTINGGDINGETWEWNGTAWSRHIVSGPRARNVHAMAYDSARGVTVLFGGHPFPGSGFSAETWEWNGTTWTQRMVSGPRARGRHAMVFDAARGVTVLFGGSTGESNGETWEWDGTTWTQRLVSGPWARSLHAMAYDAARGVTVLLGGSGVVNGVSTAFADTWEWNGASWTQRAVSGPSARYLHAMAYDSARGVTVLFGGNNNANYNAETWEWNGTFWTRRAVGPSARELHAMAFDASRGVTVLFGGAYYINGTTNFAETWEWNGTTWNQRTVSGPSARRGHAMAYDAARHVIVLFGGITSNGHSDETWEWNGSTWTRRMVSGPKARYGHAMAYDAARRVTVLFGGNNYPGSGYNAETWEWDGSTWTQRAVRGPSGRLNHAMAYDSARGVTVLFGGYYNNADTWEWNGIAWKRQMVDGPSTRFLHAMVYDAARGVTVLFGGSNDGVKSAETWDWNGTVWTQQVGLGPSARTGHAMAFDSARGVTVLFAGNNSTNYNAETREFGAPCAQPITTQPVAQATCLSGTADFSVTAAGSAPFTYQWQWQPGGAGGSAWVNLAEGDNADVGGVPIVHASNIAAPTLQAHPLAGYSAPRAFRCIVTNPCGNLTSNAATLTVCAGDFDCDGATDFFDYDAFVTAFEAGTPSADFDHDGAIDFFDYDAFVVAFETPC